MCRNAGVWGGGFFLLFSLVFMVTSLQLEYLLPGKGIGAGFLPFWMSLLMAILSSAYIIDAIKNNPLDMSEVLPDKAGLKTISLLFLYMVLFVAVVNYVGFTIATTLMLFLMYRGYLKWYVNFGVSLGIALLLYGIFVFWLKVALPVNDFGW